MYEIKQFFGAYFNQDWAVDYKNPEEAIKHYMFENSTESIEASLAELQKLLGEGKSESEMADYLLHVLLCYYYPPGDGLTFAEWLRSVARQLAEGLKEKRNEN